MRMAAGRAESVVYLQRKSAAESETVGGTREALQYQIRIAL